MSRGFREVAIVAFAQLPSVRRAQADDAELVAPVVTAALDQCGMDRRDIGFVCSGSCDYLIGRPFSFVAGLDAVGAWPPMRESHVEMDGAWALWEAYIRLQHGDIDTALVYGFGRSSLGDLAEVMTQQLDPYYLQPLWPDAISMAALQARALLDSGRYTERDLAEVAARNRANAKSNPNAQVTGSLDIDALLAEPYLTSPLRKHTCPPVSDGSAAVILATAEKARELCERPAWISGIDHRIEAHSLGARDLTRSPSTRKAAEVAGAADGTLDVAEIYAPFAHQELILRDELPLSEATDINPSGGAMAANPLMVAGLLRVGEVARRIHDGSVDRGLAHATSGPCLQHNLVAILEARA